MCLPKFRPLLWTCHISRIVTLVVLSRKVFHQVLLVIGGRRYTLALTTGTLILQSSLPLSKCSCPIYHSLALLFRFSLFRLWLEKCCEMGSVFALFGSGIWWIFHRWSALASGSRKILSGARTVYCCIDNNTKYKPAILHK